MPKRLTGISFIETMIIIVITSIIIGLSIPLFNQFYQNTNNKQNITAFENQLRTAKRVALTHNATVTLCSSSDLSSCQESSWSNGFITFIDYNGNHIRDPNDVILHHQLPYPKGHNLTLNALHSNHFFQFKPLGMITHNGAFSYQIKESQLSKKFIVSQRGRIRKLWGHEYNSK